jgi:hypothetical protein
MQNTSKTYNVTFPVPGNVWDATYGEITLTYTVKQMGIETKFTNLTLGFEMTHVKNIYLEKLEQDFRLLNSTYWQLNQTYMQLLQNYTAMQRSLNELDNTRRVVAILVVTTVFFVATTLYLVLRRPRDYW